MEVHLQQWEHEIPGDTLMRYGSPYFSRSDAGAALTAQLLAGARRIASATVTIHEHHILCCNEAFPEAALADPVADLRVWDEWLNGHRIFPYPGRFSRLGLTKQEAKTSSPSSVGVLGEILAGIFSQSYVSPQVLVRCIRHWPDLIFYAGNDIYSFVESKAFTSAALGSRLNERVPEALLKELMCDAVQQLNADPHLEIWGAFTGIVTVEPDFTITLTMLRLSPPEAKRRANPRSNLPQAVVRGVAERAVAQAAAKLGADEIALLSSRRGKDGPLSAILSGKRVAREDLEAGLSSDSMTAAESVLTSAAGEDAIKGSRLDIEKEIRELIRGFKPTEDFAGKRFFEIKQRAERSTLQRVRRAGAEFVFMADLSLSDLHEVEAQWKSSWADAAKPITEVDGLPVWRAGGAVFCLGPESIDGKPVTVRKG